MTALRKTALVTGIFYLISFVSIPTLALYGTLKTEPALAFWLLVKGFNAQAYGQVRDNRDRRAAAAPVTA